MEDQYKPFILILNTNCAIPPKGCLLIYFLYVIYRINSCVKNDILAGADLFQHSLPFGNGHDPGIAWKIGQFGHKF